MEENDPRHSAGRFAGSILCGIAGFGLAIGGLLQLNVGLYNFVYPTAWHVSSDPLKQGLGPPAIATPDTIWMNPAASNAENLLTVSIASVAGLTLLAAAWLWRGATWRRAAAVTFLGAALSGIFLLRLASI